MDRRKGLAPRVAATVTVLFIVGVSVVLFVGKEVDPVAANNGVKLVLLILVSLMFLAFAFEGVSRLVRRIRRGPSGR
jgi:hypothetical protein